MIRPAQMQRALIGQRESSLTATAVSTAPAASTGCLSDTGVPSAVSAPR